MRLILLAALLCAASICYGSAPNSRPDTARAKPYPITAMSVAVKGNYTVYCNGRAAEVADWCQELRPWGSRKIHVDVQHGVPNWSAIRWLDEGFMWNVYVSGDTPESVREELRSALRALDGPPWTLEVEWDE